MHQLTCWTAYLSTLTTTAHCESVLVQDVYVQSKAMLPNDSPNKPQRLLPRITAPTVLLSPSDFSWRPWRQTLCDRKTIIAIPFPAWMNKIMCTKHGSAPKLKEGVEKKRKDSWNPEHRNQQMKWELHAKRQAVKWRRENISLIVWSMWDKSHNLAML